MTDNDPIVLLINLDELRNHQYVLAAVMAAICELPGVYVNSVGGGTIQYQVERVPTEYRPAAAVTS